MYSIEITGNGRYPLKSKDWAVKTIVYMPSNIGSSAVTFGAYDTPLEDGSFLAGVQNELNHGRDQNIYFDVDGFDQPFTIHFHEVK